jgi:hypothetical protein
MTPDSIKAIIGVLAAMAAIIGGLYGVVTIPILRTIKAEISGSESRIQTRMIQIEMGLEKRIAGVEKQMVEMEARLEKRITGVEKQMVEMEARLNQRIDTRLVHR